MGASVCTYKKLIRVLFITRKWPPAVGGMETYSYELTQELQQMTDLTVIALPGGKDGRPPSALALIRFFFTAFRAIAFSRRYDVVHVGDLVLWPLALVARIFQPQAKVIVTAYGLDIVYRLRTGLLPQIYRFYLAANVLLCRKFLRIIAISHATAALVKEMGFVDVIVIPLGVCLNVISNEGKQNNRGYLLFVGRLVRRKGAAWFVKNVMPLLDNNITLKIAGPRWDSDEWATISTSERVEYLGVVPSDELNELRRNALAVIMPNIDSDGKDIEGFGLTALEASSVGAVLLASGIEGITDAVVDGCTGFLLPSEVPDAWVNKINEINTWSEEQRHNFIVKSQEIISSKFSWGRVARDTVIAYRVNTHNQGYVSRSHAILDEITRSQKAKKIELLVQMRTTLRMGTMLEVGCGSGFIAHYFSRLGYGERGTFAVDVVDERQVTDGFNFQLVEDVNLPFSDNKFDFIISNHVIEHVGDSVSQVKHLKEIYRTLEPDGVLYFAAPNRWRFIEPHYRLPFLSWLPNSIASIYLRLARKGSHYDCAPLSRIEAVALLTEQGFIVADVTLDAIRLVGEIEGGNAIKKLLTRLPKGFWKMFSFFMPTLIFVCRKAAS